MLLLLVASAVLILGPAAAQTDPPTTGDWTVADTTVVENQTIELKGDLTVSNGGNLTLRNVTLKVFSGSTYGTNGITVEAGGTLRIEDYNKTPSDQGRSTVMRGNPSRGYFFIAKPDSKLVLLNSNISGMGALPVSRGVLVQANNTSIMGVMFIDGDQYGLRLEGTDGPAIINSGFYLSDYGLILKDTINVTVAQSTFTRNSKDGIWLDNATWTRLDENLVSNNNLDGMVVTDSEDLVVTDSIFYENTNGVVFRGVSDVLMDDCQINKSAFVGLILEDGTENVSLSDVEIFDIGRSGIEGNGVRELSLVNSTIRDCTYFGIRLLNRIFGLMMDHNYVIHNGYDGIHIEGAVMVNMALDNISRNGYNGIFMINSQDIMIHRVTLDNNAYDGINLDSVSRAILEGISASENGYNGVYIQAGSNRTSVWGSHLINNTRSGLAIDSAHDVDVVSCNISQNLDYSIRLESDAYLIQFDHCNIVNNAVGGIRVDNSRGIVGENVTLLGGGAHVALDVMDGSDIWILNSTLMGTVDMIGFGNATIVDPTSEVFVPQVTAGSWLDLAYWVEVEVIWPDMDPVDNATVNITSINGSRRSTTRTEANGTTGILPVTIRTWDGGAPIERNPTTIKAVKGTEWAGRTLRITSNTRVLIILEDTIPPVPVAPDIWVELNSLVVMNGTASHDNGQVVSWTWTFDDGVGTVVLVGPTASWTFTELGDFQGELNVT
ncbi:MAG: right-handed parallel beta-helix repeat-containing protein, partial [Thermoplasmata archaeon]|nr:right-handed parallel beta-helix repeat-containing protein [Thermoplasmata archaeon]